MINQSCEHSGISVPGISVLDKNKASVVSLAASKLLVLILILLPLSPVPVAGMNGTIEIRRSVIANGGQTSSSAQITLTGSIGQSLIASSTKSNVRLNSGFWVGTIFSDTIFSDGFEQ